jgi:hypothetical protein
MADITKKKRTSTFKIILYMIIGLVLLTLFLEMTGIADVAGKRETKTIIDRPHAD